MVAIKWFHSLMTKHFFFFLISKNKRNKILELLHRIDGIKLLEIRRFHILEDFSITIFFH